MVVLDGNSDSSDKLGDGTSDKSGQIKDPHAAGEAGQTSRPNREGQTPEIVQKSLPVSPGRARGFGQYFDNGIRKPKIGYPCLNCDHTHLDHSYYNPRGCLIADCQCNGFKMDHKLIPSKLDNT